MSKLNAGLYSSEDMTWQTPPDLVSALLKFEEREQFDLDAASTQRNIPAMYHYTENGLFCNQEEVSSLCGLGGPWQVHTGVDEHLRIPLVWLNPPYGKKLKLFMAKASYEARRKNVSIWALIPARTETIYQHEFGITKADFTVFLKGRLEFWKDGKPHLVFDKKTKKWKPGVAPFPTMLLYWGRDWERKAERWLKNPPLSGTLMLQGKELLKRF